MLNQRRGYPSLVEKNETESESNVQDGMGSGSLYSKRAIRDHSVEPLLKIMDDVDEIISGYELNSSLQKAVTEAKRVRDNLI